MITVTGGDYGEPLMISVNPSYGSILSITPLGGHNKKLSVEIK